MDIRLCSCSGAHGQIRKTLWKLLMYTDSPDHCAVLDFLLPGIGIPMLSATYGLQNHWWYGHLSCSPPRSCHGGLWWYSCSKHPHFSGIDMWNPCTISDSACPHGSPDLAYSRIFYGACLAFSTAFCGERFGGIIICLSALPIVIVGIRAGPQPSQKPADTEIFLMTVNKSINL